MLTFQKYLKSKELKHKFVYSMCSTVSIFLIITFLAYFTDISVGSNFDFTMIKPKIIDFNHVFLSNFKIILLNVVIGVVTFGIFSLFLIFENIYTLAVVANTIIKNKQFSLLLRIMPHGILEIFVLCFSIVILIVVLMNLFKVIKNIIQRNNSILILKDIFLKLIYDLAVVTVLLIFAGIIERIVSIYL